MNDWAYLRFRSKRDTFSFNIICHLFATKNTNLLSFFNETYRVTSRGVNIYEEDASVTVTESSGDEK